MPDGLNWNRALPRAGVALPSPRWAHKGGDMKQIVFAAAAFFCLGSAGFLWAQAAQPGNTISGNGNLSPGNPTTGNTNPSNVPSGSPQGNNGNLSPGNPTTGNTNPGIVPSGKPSSSNGGSQAGSGSGGYS